ncbi:hypothetical protein [Mycobacteroides abscessus]|uniref:hypothetical protein n=1 Tax=Mycobacteroides abscessus TaxID=36809 RepID=UPI0007F9534B|nr:hypothetical protein [Mycobacteroides abscessus]ANO12760.1 hypothetical protein BAB77_01865 [Mycobacteroides abscessus]ARQ63012.1 hypothetical protein CAK77_02045 [Mycobacteroides abscessus subsp. massiliense]MBE5447575.1 hypothetical protein [Mycobacteroides abscessus]MBE5514196.1 hypothetical protein [Mycobacteroides abscessus]MBN7511817.1 hypothetical protein [Mycobacteroides abscessus subsp. massiliense]
MTDDLNTLLDNIDALEADDRGADSDAPYPWTDAATWRADGGHQEPDDEPIIPWDIPGRVIMLTAHLGDGRAASWSMLTGWSGDPCVVRAAQAVAALYSELGEMCAAARGLIGVAVDGWVSEAVWAAARL